MSRPLYSGLRKRIVAGFDQHSWGYVLRLCGDSTRRMPQAAADTMLRIRTAPPDYRVVDEAEHQVWVRGQYLALVNGIMQRRGPNSEEVDVVRELGAPSATQGLTLETVVAGYHVGYQHLWRWLVSTRDVTASKAQRICSESST